MYDLNGGGDLKVKNQILSTRKGAQMRALFSYNKIILWKAFRRKEKCGWLGIKVRAT